MIDKEVYKPEDAALHAALLCPAYDRINGRCKDAVCPFLFLADRTGKEKYLTAAIDVMKWSKNVSRPNGNSTVIPNPKSWRGIALSWSYISKRNT